MVTLSYDARWVVALWDNEDSEIRKLSFSNPIDIPPEKVIQFENKEIEYENCLYFYELYRDGKKPKPIWVRAYKDGYQVLDGHHRLDTAQRLRLPKIEAYIVPPELIRVKKQYTDLEYEALLKRYGLLQPHDRYINDSRDIRR